MVRVRFAGAVPKKRWLDIGFWLPRRILRPRHRGKGIGRALLLHLAKVAAEKGYSRFEWQVLDWNTPAIEVFQSLGAQVMKEWLILRASHEALERLAAQVTN